MIAETISQLRTKLTRTTDAATYDAIKAELDTAIKLQSLAAARDARDNEAAAQMHRQELAKQRAELIQEGEAIREQIYATKPALVVALNNLFSALEQEWQNARRLKKIAQQVKKLNAELGGQPIEFNVGNFPFWGTDLIGDDPTRGVKVITQHFMDCWNTANHPRGVEAPPTLNQVSVSDMDNSRAI
jgi:hypothetical protein